LVDRLLCTQSTVLGIESTLVYADRRLHFDTIIPVSWDVIRVFRELQLDFLLLLVAEDPASAIMEARLNQFVSNVGVGLLVTKVSLLPGEEAASRLSASMVPQLRLFTSGSETRRVRGVTPYDNLRDFCGKG